MSREKIIEIIGPERLWALELQGFAIVPVEPTDDMKWAGGEAQSKSIGSYGEPGVVYRAMLQSAKGE